MQRSLIIRTITKEVIMEMYNPPHPGAMLREEMHTDITVSDLARHLGMTRANLSMILNGRLGISAAVAIKLGEAFPKTNAKLWMDLQTQYDLAHARRKKRRKIAPILHSDQKPSPRKQEPRLRKAA
jgi:addiction module HigA family antidote